MKFMSKFLNIFRVFLFAILILLNIYCVCFKTGFVGLRHAIYLLLLWVVLFVTVKDIIKKNKINNSKIYHILSILIFLTMNIILFRVLFDSHFFFNNVDLINKYENYSKVVGGYATNFSEYAKWYLKQNMIYFNVMFVLMFIYRRINLNIKNN